MYQKYSFVPVCALLFMGLAGWSYQVQHSAVGTVDLMGLDHLAGSSEKNIIEFLVQIIHYEQKFHRNYGRYTKLIYSSEIEVPSYISENYSVQVVISTSDEFLVVATSDSNQKKYRQISMNQDFEIRSNFSLPLASLERFKLFSRQEGLQEGLNDPSQNQLILEKITFVQDKKPFPDAINGTKNEMKKMPKIHSFALPVHPSSPPLEVEEMSSQ